MAEDIDELVERLRGWHEDRRAMDSVAGGDPAQRTLYLADAIAALLALRARAEAAEKDARDWKSIAELNAATGRTLGERAEAAEARAEKAEAERDAMSAVMGQIFGARFLDPPDGGDVPLPEQVRRLCEALQQAEAERDDYREKMWSAAAELGKARSDALREAADTARRMHNEYAANAILELIDKEPDRVEGDQEVEANDAG